MLLLLVSLALTVWGFLPGQTDLLLVTLSALIASLYLFVRALRRRRTPPPKWIVVDGSNVMHWNEGKAEIATLRAVLDQLTARGFTPGVVCDANAGYKIAGKYRHDHAFGRLLGLPEDRVMVVAKGTPADPALLTAARDLGARVVSNDRFRDWLVQHPEIGAPGHLIRGAIRNGKVWLDID